MWRDPEYIPRVLTLTLGIQWACEAADLPVYASLNRGLAHPAHPYVEGVQGIMLTQPGLVISPNVYGVALHRDIWRYGSIMSIGEEDTEAYPVLMRVNGEENHIRNAHRTWLSVNGECRTEVSDMSQMVII
jgi:hypothetical protein